MIKVIVTTPTVDSIPDYSSDDVLGGLQSLYGATRSAATGSILLSCSILSKVAVAVPLRIIFFYSNPSATTFTENSTLSINSADYTKVIGHVDIQVSDSADLGTPDILTKNNINLPFILDGGTTLYACCLARGTLNLNSSSDLTFRYCFLQD